MEHHGAAFEVLIRQRLPLHLTHGSWARSPLDGPGWVEALEDEGLGSSAFKNAKPLLPFDRLLGVGMNLSIWS